MASPQPDSGRRPRRSRPPPVASERNSQTLSAADPSRSAGPYNCALLTFLAMDVEPPNTAGCIRMARAKAGLCQRDVATSARVSHWRLQQFEAGRLEPTDAELDALCTVLPIL